MSSLKHKVIAVTGAASGIGRAIARECAARGARLAIADVQQQPLKELAKELEAQGTAVTVTILDVSNSDSVDDWINGTVEYYGHLDGAANIAGIEGDSKVFCTIAELGNPAWDKVMGVNLNGVFYCLRAQLRVMKKGGSIVNAASIAGLRGRAGISAYSVSKHGVIGLTRCAAAEAGSQGVRVNAVAP
ncbi:Levodione [Cyphellophora attinorum]|uniref:Levodione n=1 Tax=Cyphellophora attinorum TaxID=1664694 RepID=A0A0N1NZX3_9EURO|nr:Levodione [Phialophora attinorum]KPI38083.1 Levodione [Phialophora attinorum]